MKFNHPLRTLKRAIGITGRRFRQGSRAWALQHSRANDRRSDTPQSEPGTASAQLDMFGFLSVTEIYPAKPRFSKTRKKGKSKRVHRKQGLQYTIRLRVREKERVNAFRPKDNMDHRLVNDETASWSKDGIIKLHRMLLTESIANAKRVDDLAFETHAEIWMWISCNKAEEPFSFIRCCEASGVDPDIMRPMLKRLLDHDMPHIDLLRRSILAAEAGDQDAIEWCLSDSKAPLSFTDTCRAAGFKSVKKARSELRLPVLTDTAAAA